MFEVRPKGFYINSGGSKCTVATKKLVDGTIQYIGAQGSTIIVQPAGRLYKYPAARTNCKNLFKALVSALRVH